MSDSNTVDINIPADNPLFRPVWDAGHHMQDPFYLTVSVGDVSAKLVLTHAIGVNRSEHETWLSTEWRLLP